MIINLFLSALTLLFLGLFLLVLANLPQHKARHITAPILSVSFATIFGIILYSEINEQSGVNVIPATLSAVMKTFTSFTNGVMWDEISGSVALEAYSNTLWFPTVFWGLHVLVILSLAVISASYFARKTLDKLRIEIATITKRKNVYHIFRDSEEALFLCKDIAKSIAKTNRNKLIIVYSPNPDDELREKVAAFNGAVAKCDEIDKPQKIENANALNYGKVVIFDGAENMEVNGERVADLIARKTILDMPPYKSVKFTDNTVKSPLNALIIGFGDLGKATTKAIIQNSQFPVGENKSNGEVSNDLPNIVVVDSNPIQYERLQVEYPEISKAANIEYLQMDVFSSHFAAEFTKFAPTLNYIVIALSQMNALSFGNAEKHSEVNFEAKELITTLLNRDGFASPYICIPGLDSSDIYTEDTILHSSLDSQAINMNDFYSRTYGKDNRDKLLKWKELEIFYKESSRAACDYIPAMLEISGRKPQEIAQIAETDPAGLRKLGAVEHRRWNAFHFCKGYSTMSIETYRERLESGISKPQQDFIRKQHVCLIPWEQLNLLDEIAGEKIGTQQSKDFDNIVNIPEFIDDGCFWGESTLERLERQEEEVITVKINNRRKK